MVYVKLKLKIVSTETNNSVCKICVYDKRFERRLLFQKIFRLWEGDRTKRTVSVCFMLYVLCMSGPGSSVGIVTDYGLDGPGIESRLGEIFGTCPDWPWGPPSLLYNGYRVLPGGKVRPGLAADHSPPSSAEVMEE
jgi:hypothetical protein